MTGVNEAIFQRSADILGTHATLGVHKIPRKITHLVCALVLSLPPEKLRPAMTVSLTLSQRSCISSQSMTISTQRRIFSGAPSINDGDQISFFYLQFSVLFKLVQRSHFLWSNLKRSKSHSGQRSKQTNEMIRAAPFSCSQTRMFEVNLEYGSLPFNKCQNAKCCETQRNNLVRVSCEVGRDLRSKNNCKTTTCCKV